MLRIPYFVFLSGNIGVGKSTVLNMMKSTLQDKNYMLIKEYIDYSPIIGEKCLEMNKKGELSDFDFQNFILDCYECQFAKIGRKEIIIVERHPYEAVDIFCKISSMPYGEIAQIRNRIDEMLVKYEIPSPENCKIVGYNTSLFKPKIIVDGITNKITKSFHSLEGEGLLCNLYCFTEDALRRIDERGRNCEREITAQFWMLLQDRYTEFFKKYE